MNSLGDRIPNELRASETRYRRLFETARDGILLLNSDTGQIEDVNPYLIEMLGFSHAEFLGKKLWDVGPFTDNAMSQEMFRELQAKGYVRYDDLPLKTKAGTAIPVEFVSNSYDCAGVKVIQCNIRNISERKQSEDQARRFGLYDALTELPNRRLFRDRLSQTMAASQRSGCFGAMVFLDIDNFKAINDTHGHDFGDLLLVEVAHRLKSCLRAIDTVARFGGDEFVVILSDLHADKVKSTAQARIAAEKIRAVLGEPYMLTPAHEGEDASTVPYHCTASIGVALFFNHQGSQDEIIKWADRAMYMAKQAGGNTTRFHDENA